MYHKGAASVWRVDDGGFVSPKDFDCLFVVPLAEGTLMAYSWAGPEGESSELVRADSSGVFRSIAIGYRYWSPP